MLSVFRPSFEEVKEGWISSFVSGYKRFEFVFIIMRTPMGLVTITYYFFSAYIILSIGVEASERRVGLTYFS
jgi:hypothetical protein